MTLHNVALFIGAVVLSAVIYLLRKRAQYSNLPPGPKPHLLTGNPHPKKFPWVSYYNLSKQYGPLVTVWNGTSPAVICNDVKTANFFLEKNARDTSDRPPSLSIVSYGKRTLMAGHTPRWRKLRKSLHHPLQPNAAGDLRPFQEKTARHVVLDILEHPESFQSHISSYAATLVVHMAYGRTDRARYSDKDIKKVVESGQNVGVMLRPGAYKLDAFPWLKYVPGYMAQANKWNDEEIELFREATDSVKEKMKSHDTKLQPCFATYLIDHREEFELDDDDISYLCGSIFSAGSDTTSASLQILIMAAACHPEDAARVAEELDGIVGKGDHCLEFADLEDKESTPLLRAFINESFRWRPVSAGGFPHRTVTDIAYENYIVPAGVNITGNHWAIHRDASYYGPNVEEFKIDRWINQDGQLKPNMKHYQFGFGRRICPGQHVASNSMLINAALLLWSFKIGKKIGPDGKPIEIDTLAFTNTANVHPLPFQVSFTPRRPNIGEIVREVQEA